MRLKSKGLLCAVLAVLSLGVVFYLRPVDVLNLSLYASEWIKGVESRSVQVRGYRVHYLAQGPASGRPVVLIHGLGGRAEDWRDLAPALVKAGYRVYTPDLPGYGRSEKPADFSYAVHDEAEIVTGFLDTLGLKQVDLGGWSMGGGIAQHVAVRHQERVRTLMLFDSAGIWELPRWDVRLFTPQTPAQLDQLDVLLMPHPPAVPGFIARDILRVSHNNAWVVQRAVRSMLTGVDATDALLPRMKMPMLLVWGELDHITPVDQAYTTHRLAPQSQLNVVAGCGHLAPGQCADRVAPVVLDFLKR